MSNRPVTGDILFRLEDRHAATQRPPQTVHVAPLVYDLLETEFGEGLIENDDGHGFPVIYGAKVVRDDDLTAVVIDPEADADPVYEYLVSVPGDMDRADLGGALAEHGLTTGYIGRSTLRVEATPMEIEAAVALVGASRVERNRDDVVPLGGEADE